MPTPPAADAGYAPTVTFDVVVVGAGVAGLSCARALSEAGKQVRVLERARGVGGRCATRRVDGQPVDHGVAFLHGSTPAFVAALDAVPGARLDGWPSVVRGSGTPCQPRAYAPGERRVAYAAGVSAFPKSLAVGLDVLLETSVVALEVGESALAVHAEQRGTPVRFFARDVVLALAGPQALRLLGALPASKSRDTARALLTMMPSTACATVIAMYERGRDILPWQVWYPESSETLLLISHDSSKRPDPEHTALVVQARPAWSRAQLAGDERQWAADMLADAARLIGPWVERPKTLQAHRWRHARTGPESELAAPLVLSLDGGCRIGLAGELWAAGGGVQAAWQSGEQLARRLLDEVTQ